MTLTPVSEVRPCRAAEIFDDPASEGLFAEYRAECVNPVVGPALAPDKKMYESLEQIGVGYCFGAYREGVLCGFALVVAGKLPGYAEPHARVERLFVSVAARGSRLGVHLMAAVEDCARALGCDGITYSAPAGGQLANLLYLRPDRYVCTNHIFCRNLR